MSELDDDVLEVLTKARRALSPTPLDQARVLERTLRAASLPAAPVTSSLGVKLALALTIAGVSGTIGYVLRRQASLEPRAPEVRAAPPVVAAVPVEPPAPVQREPEVVAAEVTPKKAPHVRAKVAPVENAVDPFAEVRGAATSALEIEVRFMKAVERALRDNEPGLALRMLDQLDEEVPQGSLAEERLAASVMARCKLGLGNRQKLVEQLTDRYPASAYKQRVRDSCDRH